MITDAINNNYTNCARILTLTHAVLNFEGSFTPLCSLENCSCCHLHGMCDAIHFPFCSVNARGLLYITLCGLVLVKQYLCCVIECVCSYIASSRAASKAFKGDAKTGACPSWSSHGPYWPLCCLQYTNIHTWSHKHRYCFTRTSPERVI